MEEFVAEEFTINRISVEQQINFNTITLLSKECFRSLFSPEALESGLGKLVASILTASDVIGYNLRNCEYSSEEVGTTNAFGDSQLDVDVKCDHLIFKALELSRLVAIASSEEKPIEVNCDGNGFAVSFDPLDGSSIVDANFAVGSIFGVWKGNHSFLNRTGRELAASLIVQYGPRVTAMVGFDKSATFIGEPLTIEMTHTADKGWIVSIPKVNVKTASKTFAPGNLRATFDNLQYKALVDYWIAQKYTLRYSGGLVPDVYHILAKGGGVLSNASSKGAKAKLRLIYECAPIALIMESAGGSSCVCSSEVGEAIEPTSILDVVVNDLDRRIGVCYGSKDEVDRFKQYIFST